MKKSPTASSLALLRAAGWFAVDVTGYQHPSVWAAICRKLGRPEAAAFPPKRDLLGIFDILAFRPNATLAVQATSAANMAARRKKMLAAPGLPVVLAAGWLVELHGWHHDGRLRQQHWNRTSGQPDPVVSIERPTLRRRAASAD